ncbi:MAG: carboxypeptidase, partial [Chloroflexi bacterium]|nr:carboxypeptidase [Chloroflexota bacterium]
MATSVIRALLIANITALAVATTAHPLVGQPSGRHTTPASTTPALYVWRVFVRDEADVLQLTSGEWDVLESRGQAFGADYLLVLGDDAVADALRAQGWRVEVDEVIATPGIPTPYTYYNGYRTVAEHEQHLDDVVAAHPELAQRVDYGDSWRKEQGRADGHDLLALCLTKLRPGDCTPGLRGDKARLLIIAGVHARELVPPELAWRWIDELVNGYDANPDITALLDYNEVWVIPQANPDGRTIVEQGGSSPLMQRKNANSSYGSCGTPGIGVDLNRNASFHWGGSGASSSPCSELYRGPHADSEPETTALQALMLGLFDDQRGPALADKAPMTTTGLVLNLHSYGNLVMLPWDYTTAHTPNDAELRSIAFRLSYHNGYRAGQYPEVLYLSSGTQDDWSYGQLGVPNLTFEVGTNFMPAYSLVNSSYWPQNRGALRYAAQIARQPYSLASGPAAILSTLSPTIKPA